MLNPTASAEVREKISRTLKTNQYVLAVRGGNGCGPTEAQSAMASALGQCWLTEYALSLGPRQIGYPTHYKLDLANLAMRIAIEVDGKSHYSGVRKMQDEKKSDKLASLGWIVLRFWNWDVLAWIDAGMPDDSHVSQVLATYGVQVHK